MSRLAFTGTCFGFDWDLQTGYKGKIFLSTRGRGLYALVNVGGHRQPVGIPIGGGVSVRLSPHRKQLNMNSDPDF